MAFRERMLHHIQHCLHKWTMLMTNCHNVCPLEASTTEHMARHHKLEQIEACHKKEGNILDYASSALAKAPTPTQGSAHPIPMQAEERLYVAVHWVLKDWAEECEYMYGAPEKFPRSPRFAEKKRVRDNLPQKHHGETQNLWEPNMICI